MDKQREYLTDFIDFMMEREDGKHLSYNELMESDIFGLMESEMRIYNKQKKKNEISAEAAFELF